MLVRAGFYLLDALSLRRVVSKLSRRDHDFIIFDRYLYDELVQIQPRHWLARAYIRLLLRWRRSPSSLSSWTRRLTKRSRGSRNTRWTSCATTAKPFSVCAHSFLI